MTLLMTTQLRDTAFATLFQGLYDPAFVVDAEGGSFIAANEAAARLLGYTMDDLATLSPSDIHPHEVPRLRAFLGEVMTHGRWRADDLSCRCRDGSYVPAEARATALQLDGQDCVLIQIRDLRPEILAEVGRSVRKLAHDLRNALTTSQLLADRLAGSDDAAVRKNANVIARSLDRALVMCQDTVNAGRSDSETVDRERFLLDDVIEEVAATMVMPSGLGTQIAFEPAEAVPLDADFDQVYRIFVNLLRNASEAGADLVRVDGRREEGRAVLMVEDNGPGLPAFIRDNLNREKPDLSSGSSGLGLMICCELAMRHGGEMKVARSDSTGTRFRITIPDAS